MNSDAVWSKDVVHEVTLVLECLRDDACFVIFEPFGAEYSLDQDDEFRVVIAGPGSGDVRVWVGQAGTLSVTPWVGGDYVGGLDQDWSAAGYLAGLMG